MNKETDKISKINNKNINIYKHNDTFIALFKKENIYYNIENEALLPLQQIIFGQILSFLKSKELGITPDNPCPTGEVNRVVQGVILHDLNK